VVLFLKREAGDRFPAGDAAPDGAAPRRSAQTPSPELIGVFQEERNTEMNTLLAISLLVLGFGMALLAFSGLSFKFRALCNKPAWGGPTVPSLLVGLAFFAPGLVMVYLFFPK
jgi:hypothetical protein